MEVKNATYIVPSVKSGLDRRVEMINGIAEYGDSEKLTFERAAFGDLNGDGKEDAVAQFSYKSNRDVESHYLEFFLNSAGQPRPINVIGIGSNVFIDTLEVTGSGTACLTFPVDGRTSTRREYKVVGGLLKEVNSVNFNPFMSKEEPDRSTSQLAVQTRAATTARDTVTGLLKESLNPSQLEQFDLAEKTWAKFKELHIATIIAVKGLKPNTPTAQTVRKTEELRLIRDRTEHLKAINKKLMPPVSMASSRHKFADALLNKTYGKLTEKSDAESKKILRLAELAWLAYRDQDTNFRCVVLDMPPHAPERDACLFELTRERTRQLDDLLKLISIKSGK